MNTLTTFIEKLGGKAAAGGYVIGLVAVLSFITDFQIGTSKSYQAVITRLTEMNANLETDREFWRAAAMEERERYQQVFSAHKILSAARGDEPLLAWVKDREGRLISWNKSYEQDILIANGLTPESSYLKTDLDLWPDSNLAKVYREHDLEVMRTRRLHIYRENAIVGGVEVPYVSYKYPLLIDNNVLGVAAQAHEDCQ